MNASRGLAPAALRWSTAPAVLLCIATAALLAGREDLPGNAPHLFVWASATLTLYGWMVYPLAVNLMLSVAVSAALLWAWLSGWSAAPGVEGCTLLAALIVAVLARRRRTRAVRRLQQAVDDLKEERTVKEQAIALAHALHEALQKKLSRYVQLQAIAEDLSRMTELAFIGQLAVERAFSLIGKSDVCLLFLVDKEQQQLSLCASKKRDSVSSIRTKHGDQFDRYVLRTHRPLLVNDVRRDFRFTVTVTPDRPTSSVIACPLVLGQSPEGVLRLDSQQPGAYTQDDLRLLDIFLDLIATTMTNARLFAQTQRLAVTDGLTGLRLRRPFLEEVARELTRAARSHEAASIVMVDVDHFKEYNDACGHMAGDVILKMTAAVVRSAVPAGAVSARYGGDEFAVLLPRLPRHQASEIAERIRCGFERQMHSGGQRAPLAAEASGEQAALERQGAGREGPPVSVSLGVSSFPDDGQVELELIRVADRRLYDAKRSGRNLVRST